MKIILDAMGGDYAPIEIVKGAVAAAAKFENVKVVLVGNEQKVNEELKKYPKHANIEVVHAEDDIAMSEHPVEAIRTKKNSSINVAMRLVRDGQGQAFVSAGNTGACMASALFTLGRIKGIERPAICSVFPSVKGRTVVLDMGANADCKPSHLVQFAYMGKAYIEKVVGVSDPRIGLLSIGEEPEKGNELTIATHQLLAQEKAKGLNFIGNIEGKDIMQNEADVVVCDGFTGNVVLKFAEGVIHALQKMVKQNFNLLAWFGLLFQIKSLKGLKKALDYTEYGGAPLLGVNGVVIITHGRAKAKTITNAIFAAAKAVNQDLVKAIAEIKAEKSVG